MSYFLLPTPYSPRPNPYSLQSPRAPTRPPLLLPPSLSYDSRDEAFPRGPRAQPVVAPTAASRSTSARCSSRSSSSSVGVCTFWNSLGAPFIWDDQTAIVTNQTLQHLWPLSDPLTPPRETPVAGRPLVNLSRSPSTTRFGGLTVTGYHAVNIAIHIACALLLFGIVGRTLAGPRIPSGVGRRGERAPLWLSRLLWLVHPLQSEVVDYVTQRSESLMALFFLLTLVRRDSSQAIRRRDASQPPGLRHTSRGKVADAVGRRVRVRDGVEGVDGGRARSWSSSTTGPSNSTRWATAWRRRRISTPAWRRHGSCSPRSSGTRRDRPSARR